MTQTIWIARHGNRQDFVDPTWRQRAERPFDPALSDDGIVQAQELGQRLRGENIHHIFVSPFLRTVQTAYYVAEALQLSMKIEAGLSEFLNPGWFSSAPKLLSLRTLASSFPRIDQRYTSQVLPRFPETGDDALARAGHTARLLASQCDEDFLMVGHGASVMGATRGLVSGDPEFRCQLCCLVKIVRQANDWMLDLAGDTSHLSVRETSVRFN